MFFCWLLVHIYFQKFLKHTFCLNIIFQSCFGTYLLQKIDFAKKKNSFKYIMHIDHIYVYALCSSPSSFLFQLISVCPSVSLVPPWSLFLCIFRALNIVYLLNDIESCVGWSFKLVFLFFIFCFLHFPVG